MDPTIFELSLEQEFQLTQLKLAVELASKEELGDMLLQISIQLAIKDNIIRDLVRKI